MFTAYKDRSVSEGQRVQVYRNLHNGKWSIRDTKTKLVLGHTDCVMLTDAKFEVNEKGRQKVLRDKQKNVHAWVNGVYSLFESECKVEVTYDSYKLEAFVTVENESILKFAENAILMDGKVFAIGIDR